MKLTSEHREALLNELVNAQADKKTNQRCIENNPVDAKWFEAKEFLANQRIELIKQSLIANEIDY